MKQTKLREPIFYTCLYIASFMAFTLINKPINIDSISSNIFIQFIMIILSIPLIFFILLWWLLVLKKRADWYETKDITVWYKNRQKEILEEIEDRKEDIQDLMIELNDIQIILSNKVKD